MRVTPKEALRRIQRATMRGCLQAALGVEASAKKRVPVEYGNLRASAYSRKHMAIPNAAEVGFTAAYAFYVHENVDMKWKGKERKSKIGVYWGPHGEAKFLYNALYENREAIRRVIADELRREMSK